jgi:hypothetical protein
VCFAVIPVALHLLCFAVFAACSLSVGFLLSCPILPALRYRGELIPSDGKSGRRYPKLGYEVIYFLSVISSATPNFLVIFLSRRGCKKARCRKHCGSDYPSMRMYEANAVSNKSPICLSVGRFAQTIFLQQTLVYRYCCCIYILLALMSLNRSLWFSIAMERIFRVKRKQKKKRIR